MTIDPGVQVADAYAEYIAHRRAAEAQAARTARSGCWADRYDLEGVLFMLFFGWWIFLLYGVGRLLGLVGPSPKRPERVRIPAMQHYTWNAHTQRYDIPVKPVSPPPPCYCAYGREYCPIHRGY